MCKSDWGISLQSLWAVFVEPHRISVCQCWGIAAVENDAVPLVTESELRRSQTESRCGDKMITRYSLEMWGMVFVHCSVCDENGAGGGDGGVKIKKESEKAWRMKKRGGGTDGGDKMRQIEKGTMRLGEQEGVTGTIIRGWQHQSGRIKAETEARESLARDGERHGRPIARALRDWQVYSQGVTDLSCCRLSHRWGKLCVTEPDKDAGMPQGQGPHRKSLQQAVISHSGMKPLAVH